MARKKKKKPVLIILIVAFIAVLAFSLDIGGFLKPVRSGTDVILNPVRYWFSNQSRIVSTFFRDLSSISSLRQENNELKQRVYSLESEVVELKSVQNENKSLRDQLELPERDSYDLILAHIIGGDLQTSNFSRFIIDKGTDAGVEPGDTVVYSEFFIGQVRETTLHSSIIELVSNGNLNVPVISEDNRTKGIVTGDVNTGLIMGKILREETLDENERILTSGIGDYPRNLILGRVAMVEGEDADVEKTAVLKNGLDLQTIEEVFVIHAKEN